MLKLLSYLADSDFLVKIDSLELDKFGLFIFFEIEHFQFNTHLYFDKVESFEDGYYGTTVTNKIDGRYNAQDFSETFNFPLSGDEHQRCYNVFVSNLVTTLKNSDLPNYLTKALNSEKYANQESLSCNTTYYVSCNEEESYKNNYDYKVFKDYYTVRCTLEED